MADITKQIRLLESQDTKVSDDARAAITIQINIGNGIENLVQYYARERSERALDLLCKIKEPHDKILMDSLIEAVKAKKVQETLILLGQIIQQGPAWTPKITQHQLFACLLSHMKNLKNVESGVYDCISLLLFITLLLPHSSSIPSTTLHNIFQTFLSCCDYYRKMICSSEKVKTDIDKINVYHLGFALRELFQTLYGMYPWNFLSYLRKVFLSQDRDNRNLEIGRIVITPLLYGVRLHPRLVFNDREDETSKQRWSQKEAHDFLEEVRQIIIGIIPVPSQNEETEGSEPDSPTTLSRYALSQMFNIYRTDVSSSSSNFDVAWSEQSDEILDRSLNLMDLVNTPPGSISGTPVHKRSTVDDGGSPGPLVIKSDERKRRPSHGTETRGFRLSSISSVFRRDRHSHDDRDSIKSDSKFVNTSPALIEIENAEEDTRRVSEGDPAEDAEEAMDCITPSNDTERPHQLQSDEAANSRELIKQLFMASPPLPKSKTTSPELSPNNPKDPNTSNSSRYTETSPDISKAQADGEKIIDAVEAARRAVRERASTTISPEDAVNRSRSASLLCGVCGANRKEDVRDRIRTFTIDPSSSAKRLSSQPSEGTQEVESTDGRSRFSVTSYFSRINRQRFVSECKTQEQENRKDCSYKSITGSSLQLAVRSTSCPNLHDKSDQIAARLRTVHTTSRTAAAAAERIDPVKQFPYLKLIAPLDSGYFGQLESRLAVEHSNNRVNYMKASKNFHSCLKELSLADRLPGRIYDDMSHITQGLSLDKQVEILRTRLQLVNQHLLYERSCRMLHANRNRRLFGKIKLQRVTEAEMNSCKEKLHNVTNERFDLTQALSDMRRKLLEQRHLNEKKISAMDNEMKRMQKELHEQASVLIDANQRVQHAEQIARNHTQQMDMLRREADDARENLRLYQTKMEMWAGQSAELKRAHEENQTLRDQLALAENRRDDDRLRSPDSDDLKIRIRQLEAELERVTREKDKERLTREEIKEKYLEMEHNFKSEAGKCDELRMLLDRSARLLCEQNEAAEQKFLSLQAVAQQQEKYISELYVLLEDAQDQHNSRDGKQKSAGPPMKIPERAGVTPEIRSYGSTTSEAAHSYFIRDIAQVHPSSQSSPHESDDNEHTQTAGAS